MSYEGSTAHFKCKSASVPKWTKKGVSEKVFMVMLHNLVIHEVTEKDSGVYICEGYVDVWHERKFKISAKLLVASKNMMISMQCIQCCRS